MNLADLRGREAFDDVLASTLARHLSRVRRTHVEVAGEPRSRGGSRWREHRLFGAFVGPGDSRRAREFLTDLYRFSPSLTRLVPQAAAATLAGSKRGFDALSLPTLWISDPFEDRKNAPLLLPGNQRVRWVDFDANVVHVFQKDGFELRTMRNEVETRIRFGSRFLDVLDHDVDDGWFTEPLVAAWALARIPPWVNRTAATNAAREQLRAWRAATRRSLARDAYARQLCDALAHETRRLDDTFRTAMGAHVRTLATRLLAGVHSDTVEVAQSHGDFQAGNVLVRKEDHEVTLIDLEHAGERSSAYDELTFALASRAAAGLAERATAHLAITDAPTEARDALAWFLVEDLLFFVRESLSGPFRRPSEGLRLLLIEVHRLLTMGSWPE